MLNYRTVGRVANYFAGCAFLLTSLLSFPAFAENSCTVKTQGFYNGAEKIALFIATDLP